jgi:hypothetical protein
MSYSERFQANKVSRPDRRSSVPGKKKQVKPAIQKDLKKIRHRKAA